MQCPLYILVLIGLTRKRMDEYQNRTEHKMIFIFNLIIHRSSLVTHINT